MDGQNQKNLTTIFEQIIKYEQKSNYNRGTKLI